jgi:hypothetical protein
MTDHKAGTASVPLPHFELMQMASAYRISRLVFAAAAVNP